MLLSKMFKTIIVYFFTLAAFQTRLSTCDVHIYASPNGSDQNDGLSDKNPVKTFQTAVSLAGNKKYNNETVYIELMQGYYDLDKTLYITRPHTVVRSYKSQEVHVTGGLRIPHSYIETVKDHTILSRLPANARAHVRVVNLHQLNVTDLGKMEPYGSGIRRNLPLEVFFNGLPLRLARWPNKDFIDVVDVPDGLNGLRFRYNSTIPQSWQTEHDPWVYGYWYAGWTDGAVKVTSLDARSMTVTVAKSPPHGIRKGHLQEYLKGISNRDGGYFRFMNIFSELDEPGEYYLDRGTGNLYMWFPEGGGNIKSSDVIYVSMVKDCLVVTQPNVQLQDFSLEYCRGRGILLTDNADHTKVTKLEIGNMGNFGLLCSGNTIDIEISQCYIHDTCGGIFMSGGQRTTLESSGNIIQNNEFTRYDRVGSIGNDALSLYGVGHVVRNNHFYDGQTGAINFNGNDIVMEYNLIHNVCQMSSSCNAIHTGYDWTFRGNIIQYNIVHNVIQFFPGGTNRAILLDGLASGTSIKYNVFLNNTCHVYIGGGRYNEIINNVMYNATSFAIHVDARGMSYGSDTRMMQKLHAMPYLNSTWSMRYPHLANIDNEDKYLPEGNQIVKNIMYMHPTQESMDYITGIPKQLLENVSLYFNVSQTGFSAGSVDHHNLTNSDLRLKCNAYRWANRVNFQQPPSPNAVGPLVSPVGPTYLNRGRWHLVDTAHAPYSCTMKPPAEVYPVSSYLPDGYAVNTLYPVGKTGCWLNVTRCHNHTGAIGTYRDMYGERYRNAADNETMCFRQALEQWQYCGSNNNEWVVAIYAPTGSATIGGHGCMIATYGCPKHGGPADGHLNTTSGRYQFVGQAHPGEEYCLIRARDFWYHCGASPNYPVTSVYLPTGAKHTVGAGCWITVEKCPADLRLQSRFYDAEGSTNYHTDDFEFACLHRAEYFWHHCGSNPKYPVTASFRPNSVSLTYP